VNVPKRGVGDKTIKDIEATAKQKGISCYEIVSKAVRGNNMANIKPGQKTALRSFCEVIKTIRKMAVEGTPVQDLIEYVVTAVQYKEHLERTHGLEHTTKLENVNELK
jgi:DNA helicase-2/ATP-dependent DNA helicase PcrA